MPTTCRTVVLAARVVEDFQLLTPNLTWNWKNIAANNSRLLLNTEYVVCCATVAAVAKCCILCCVADVLLFFVLVLVLFLLHHLCLWARHTLTPQPKIMKPNTPCKFNESRPKSYLDWIVYFSKQLPSPNKYRVGGKTRWNCSSEVASGGRFTSSVRPSFITDEQRRVSDHPAPGDYNTTGFRSTVKKKASRFYDSRSSLTDQINSLDAMTRSPSRSRKLQTSPMKARRRPGTAL